MVTEIVEGSTEIIAEAPEISTSSEDPGRIDSSTASFESEQEQSRITDDELREFVTQMGTELKTNLWAHLLLQSDIAAGFQILADKLIEKGVLTKEDSASMDKALTNREFLEANYRHMQHAYQTKVGRIQYALDHPEEVKEHVKNQQTPETTEKE